MFAAEERDRVRRRVLELARADARVVGAAITGSAATGAEDRWSDVDLFLGLAEGVEVEAFLPDWSALLYRELGVLHHFDLRAGLVVYRAFLLPGWLEVDTGIAPAAAFGPRGAGFHVVFGEAVERSLGTPPGAEHLAGLGWHHVYHARACVERGQPWRAAYWIGQLRDHALELACLRLGLPSAHGRGFDLLPAEVTAPLEAALVGSLGPDDLLAALRAAAGGLLREIAEALPELAQRLAEPFREIAE